MTAGHFPNGFPNRVTQWSLVFLIRHRVKIDSMSGALGFPALDPQFFKTKGEAKMGNSKGGSELRRNLQIIHDRYFAKIPSDPSDASDEAALAEMEKAQDAIEAFIEVSREITAQPGLSSSAETSQITESAAESYRNTRLKTGS